MSGTVTLVQCSSEHYSCHRKSPSGCRLFMWWDTVPGETIWERHCTMTAMFSPPVTTAFTRIQDDTNASQPYFSIKTHTHIQKGLSALKTFNNCYCTLLAIWKQHFQTICFLFPTCMGIEGSVFWNVTLRSFKQTQHVGCERLSNAFFLACLTPDNEDAAVLWNIRTICAMTQHHILIMVHLNMCTA